jgi:hypothetical protein
VDADLPAWLAVLGDDARRWWRAPIPLLLDTWAEYSQWHDLYYLTATPPPTPVCGSVGQLVSEMRAVPLSGLLMALDGGWTMYVGDKDPGRAGGHLLAALAPCDEALFWSSQGGDGADLGMWWCAAPETVEHVIHPRVESQRSVCLTREHGRSRFHQYGELFPFEDTARYRRSRPSDRLDEATLWRYAECLGIPINDLNAFTGEAVLLNPAARPAVMREETEAEAQIRLHALREMAARRVRPQAT